jgi:hypothetical protein
MTGKLIKYIPFDVTVVSIAMVQFTSSK